MSTDLYSPKLTEYIVRVAQYNIQAFKLMQDVTTDARTKDMLDLGIQQNEATLNLLTKCGANVTIN